MARKTTFTSFLRLKQYWSACNGMKNATFGKISEMRMEWKTHISWKSHGRCGTKKTWWNSLINRIWNILLMYFAHTNTNLGVVPKPGGKSIFCEFWGFQNCPKSVKSSSSSMGFPYKTITKIKIFKIWIQTLSIISRLFGTINLIKNTSNQPKTSISNLEKIRISV